MHPWASIARRSGPDATTEPSREIGDEMEPLNVRIKDFIRSRIADGTWREGDKIPSETELARQFGASRMTVNRAVKELAERGDLQRRQGLGTFVAGRATRAPLFEVQSIRQLIQDRGERHECRLLTLERHRLNSQTAAYLGLNPGIEAYYLEAVHTSGGQPLQLERRFVNPGLAPDFANQDFTMLTASEYLLKHIPFTEVEHTVDAIAADSEIQRLLGLDGDTPCLRLTRRTSLNKAIITRVELIHPGDEFKLTGRFPGISSAVSVA